MPNPIQKLAGQTAIYGLSSIVGRLLNYLLVPFYTTYFEAGAYGVVTELYSYAAFFNVLYTYGLETAYFRYAAKHKDQEKRYYGNATTVIIASTLLLTVVLWLLAPSIAQLLQYPGKAYLIRWMALILAIDACMAIPFARLRFKNRPVKFATAKLLVIGLTIGLNLFFIALCPHLYAGQYGPGLQKAVAWFYTPGFEVGYVFLANLMANATLLLLLASELRQIQLRLSQQFLKPLLNYGFPLLFMGLAGVTNEMLSRAMLKYWLPQGFYNGLSNQEALGIFGAAYRLSIFMTLGVQAFRYAAEPFFFNQAANKQSPPLFAKVTHAFVLVGCAVMLGVTANLDWLAPLILRKAVYLQGIEVVPVLLLANLFLGIYFNLSIWYKLTDRTYWGTILAVGGAAITIMGNWLLIPTLGYMGSAWVTLVVYAGMTATSYIVGQKYFKVPYLVQRGLLHLLVAAGLTATVYLYLPAQGLSGIVLKNGVLALWLLGVALAEKRWLLRLRQR